MIGRSPDRPECPIERQNGSIGLVCNVKSYCIETQGINAQDMISLANTADFLDPTQLYHHLLLPLSLSYAQENMVFPALKQGPMLTLGSDELSTDAEWEWNERLRQYSDNKPTGWHSSITLEAFVIPIAGAANPGTQGLLHHLVHRYLSKRCSYFVFALPAVQVRVVGVGNGWGGLFSRGLPLSYARCFASNCLTHPATHDPTQSTFQQAIITYKWTHYARKWLFVQLALYFAWLLCFYGFIIAFQVGE